MKNRSDRVTKVGSDNEGTRRRQEESSRIRTLPLQTRIDKGMKTYVFNEDNINPTMIVFIPLDRPPEMYEEYLAEDGDINRRTGHENEGYATYPAVKRVAVPLPGRHTNKRGEEWIVFGTDNSLSLTAPNTELRWTVYYGTTTDLGPRNNITLEKFLEWKSREPAKKVKKPVEYFAIRFADGRLSELLNQRSDAEKLNNKHGGTGQIIPLMGTEETEE